MATVDVLSPLSVAWLPIAPISLTFFLGGKHDRQLLLLDQENQYPRK